MNRIKMTEAVFVLDVSILGRRIKELRKERGLTQNQFAEVLLVSAQAVSNWERGAAPPDLDNLVRIANCFRVPIDDLLRPSTEHLFLGIDGGGTKTEFSVVSADGSVRKRLVKGGCNPNAVGMDACKIEIENGMRECICDCPSIVSVFCGISGILTGNYRSVLMSQLRKCFPQLIFKTESDSANLFAMDDKAETAIISGTGSVVFVRHGRETHRLGGWGYLLDFGGSAYNIGRDAVQTALAEEDNGGDISAVSRLLKQELGVQSAYEAIGPVYGNGMEYMASLAKIVFRAYEQHDTKAICIIEKNAESLARLLNIALERFGVSPRTVVGGGLFEHHFDIMKKHMANHTAAELISVGVPPIYGACRLAVALGGEKEADGFYDSFKETYERIKNEHDTDGKTK